MIVESEYFSHLAPNGLRMDALNRPELSKGTVDFNVPSPAYRAAHPPPRLLSSASGSLSPSTLPSTPSSKTSFFSFAPPPVELGREPQPMDFVFVFDLSLDGVRSGFVQTAAESLLDILYGPEACIPPLSRVAIVTFDSTVHFHELLVNFVSFVALALNSRRTHSLSGSNLASWSFLI
jgi:protein transport protein SEC24